MEDLHFANMVNYENSMKTARVADSCNLRQRKSSVPDRISRTIEHDHDDAIIDYQKDGAAKDRSIQVFP